MPDPVDLGYAFTLTPRNAVEYFQQKGYRISWNWFDTWQQAHARAFTVAHVARMDVLEEIRGAVDSALSEGKTLRQFRQELEPTLRKKGWWGKQVVVDAQGKAEMVQLGSPRRLRTIYQTNLQTAYMSGRWKSMTANAAERPYWQYIAILDNITRPEHRRLHKKVFRWDDPVWRYIWPPNGWGCRCRIRALTANQVQRKGLEIESSAGRLSESLELVSKKTGELRPVTGLKLEGGDIFKTDPGWNYNPGQAAWQPNLDKYPYDVAKQYVEGVVTGPPFKQWYRALESKVAMVRRANVDASNGELRELLAPHIGAHWMPVAVLENRFRQQIGAQSQQVLLSQETLVKQLINRDGQGFGFRDYVLLQSTLDQAVLVVKQKEQNILFFRAGQNYYQAVVKATSKGELFLVSYHLSNEKQMERMAQQETVILDKR